MLKPKSFDSSNRFLWLTFLSNFIINTSKNLSKTMPSKYKSKKKSVTIWCITWSNSVLPKMMTNSNLEKLKPPFFTNNFKQISTIPESANPNKTLSMTPVKIALAKRYLIKNYNCVLTINFKAFYTTERQSAQKESFTWSKNCLIQNFCPTYQNINISIFTIDM